MYEYDNVFKFTDNSHRSFIFNNPHGLSLSSAPVSLRQKWLSAPSSASASERKIYFSRVVQPSTFSIINNSPKLSTATVKCRCSLISLALKLSTTTVGI